MGTKEAVNQIAEAVGFNSIGRVGRLAITGVRAMQNKTPEIQAEHKAAKQQVTRRDFLRVAGVVTAAVGIGACADKLLNQSEQPDIAATAWAQETKAAGEAVISPGEFGLVDNKLVDGFLEAYQQLPDMEILAEYVTPFSVTSGGAVLNFISIPRTVDTATKKVLQSEQLWAFDASRSGWQQLTKTAANELEPTLVADKAVERPLISWRQPAVTDEKLDLPDVLSYIEYSAEDWEVMTWPQKQSLQFVVKPMIGQENLLPGYNRDRGDYILAEGPPDGARKVLMSIVQVEKTNLPENLQKLQERLGKNFTLKPAEVAEDELAYYEIVDAAGQKVEGVKVFEDSSTDKIVQFRGEETTLVTSIKAVSANKDGGLDWGIFTLKDGEWRIVTDGVPATAEARQNFRKMVIIKGHAKEAEMKRSTDIANMMALEPVDLPGQFKGIVVDDKYRGHYENVDLTPEYYSMNSGPDGYAFIGFTRQFLTKADNRFNARNPQMEPIRIIKEAGFFNIEVVDLSGQVIHDLMNVPVVGLNSDGTCIPLHGVMNQEGLAQMIDLLNQDYKIFHNEVLEPRFLVGSGSEDYQKLEWKSTHEYQLASDQNLRKYMAEVNHPYLVKHEDDGEGVAGMRGKFIKNLPEDLSYTFLEIALIYAHSD